MGAKTRGGAPSAGTECVAVDAMAFEPLADPPPASFPLHNVKQRSFFVPGSFRVRVLFLPFLTFVAASLELVAQVTRDATLARRGPSRATGRPASRRSAVALSAQDRLSRPGHDGRADAKAPRPPGIAARLRCRAFRIRGYHPRATPHPAPPSGSLLESAPHERDVGHIAHARHVVNIVIITYS